ncbi:MAG: SGNH/GDSL hydrolase family protein, partial [Muribaculaceae bacterium]|nr:SGNH/GDSL hydrolase family protein [Muribaculaceae bacterium]
CWYNCTDRAPGRNNDVETVEQTWWYQLIDADPDLVLERNNSYSGATVCCTGYRGEDFSDRAFISRVNNLGNPDIIIILGGTNDSWAKSPVGEFKYSDWNKADLMTFRPAFAYMLERLQALYPEALILNVVNSELSDDVTDSQQIICDHYGVKNILLEDIDKQWGHPSIAGMQSIASQVKPFIK